MDSSPSDAINSWNTATYDETAIKLYKRLGGSTRYFCKATTQKGPAFSGF
jgi:hypothetical protein